MDVLVNGLGQLDSPRWHDGRLWFADWTAGAIRTLSGRHTSRVEIAHRSLPLCFDFLPDSTLVLASEPTQAILAASAGKVLTRYAGLSGLSRYGSNDLVADGPGNIYVNNVNFDFAAGPPDGEPAPGFIALVTPDGDARVVAEDLVRERDDGDSLTSPAPPSASRRPAPKPTNSGAS
jgi:sugar lactone lactonase YvrE